MNFIIKKIRDVMETEIHPTVRPERLDQWIKLEDKFVSQLEKMSTRELSAGYGEMLKLTNKQAESEWDLRGQILRSGKL